MTDTPTIYEVQMLCNHAMNLTLRMVNADVPQGGLVRDFWRQDLDQSEAHLVAALEALRAYRAAMQPAMCEAAE